MRTLKLLAITIFLLVTNSIVAQEKQNDATLEETILWINQHAFIKTNTGGAPCCKKPYDLRYNKNEKTLTYKFDVVDKWKDKYGDYNLIKLTESSLKELRLQLWVSYRNEKIYKVVLDAKDLVENRDDLSTKGEFQFSNEDYAQRVFKAFEHLFYLLGWEVKCVDKIVDKNRF